MKVLFISFHSPYGNGGGIYATRAYANAFSAVFNDVVMIHPNIMGESHDNRLIDPRIHIIAVPIARNVACKFYHRIRGEYNYFIKKEYFSYIKKYKPDIVVYDNSHVSYKLIDVAKKFNAKTIVIHHNYEVDYVRDNTPFFLRQISLFWTRRIEKEAVLKSDINIFLTEHDLNIMKGIYPLNVRHAYVLGCFQYRDVDIAAPYFTKATCAPTFIITGNLSTRQTDISVRSWILNYYPIMLHIFPKHKLIIAGKSPSKTMIKLCSRYSQIELVSSPSDMSALIQIADYYICPTSMGSGLKMRIMDGLKYGLSVICHEVSSWGYEAFVNKGYMSVYSDSSSFEMAIRTIVAARYPRSSVMELYKQIFSFNSGVERLKKIMEIELWK